MQIPYQESSVSRDERGQDGNLLIQKTYNWSATHGLTQIKTVELDNQWTDSVDFFT